MTLRRHDFPDRHALAEALADAAEAALAGALQARATAAIAVSGGTTPQNFFAALSARPLDWPRISVTLVDERWVDESSDRSNARLVRNHLLTGAAAAARFRPLYTGAPSPDASLRRLEEELADIFPFDVAVLGMGDDGHTASFFPGGDQLSEAVDPNGGHRLCAMRAPGAGEPRITWTLAALLLSNSIYLHIEGAGKADVLQRAMQDGPVPEMPVRAILRQDLRPVDIYWAP
jgi:6-phosphogluconolactonase